MLKFLKDSKCLQSIPWRIEIFEAMIENMMSYSRSSHDDNVLYQIMSWYILKWRFVIAIILLTLEEFMMII